MKINQDRLNTQPSDSGGPVDGGQNVHEAGEGDDRGLGTNGTEHLCKNLETTTSLHLGLGHLGLTVLGAQMMTNV